MSWQAQTAVNRHSQQSNIHLFRLLLYLAEHADEAGCVDPAPNRSTMARFAGCTERTIRNRIVVLVESGELTQSRVGSGPGNPSAYQINLEMGETKGKKGERNGEKGEGSPDDFSLFSQQLADLKGEILALKGEILALKGEKGETKGGKGESERVKRLSTESADDPYLDPFFDPDDPGREAPPAPPSATAVWARVTGMWPGEMRTGIIDERMGASPDEEALRRAYRLWMGKGYSPRNVDGILDFYDQCRADPNWSPNGRYHPGQQPETAGNSYNEVFEP